jgi:hypothetical protein
MTSEERERMLALCQQIALEKEHSKFGWLIQELNDLLERKQNRIEPYANNPRNPNLGGGFAESTKTN